MQTIHSISGCSWVQILHYDCFYCRFQPLQVLIVDNGSVARLEFQLCTDCCKEVAIEGVKYELITDIKHLSILVYLHPADILSEVAE